MRDMGRAQGIRRVPPNTHIFKVVNTLKDVTSISKGEGGGWSARRSKFHPLGLVNVNHHTKHGSKLRKEGKHLLYIEIWKPRCVET
jgi:hypothetical protein